MGLHPKRSLLKESGKLANIDAYVAEFKGEKKDYGISQVNMSTIASRMDHLS